jgi:hypothetical protein
LYISRLLQIMHFSGRTSLFRLAVPSLSLINVRGDIRTGTGAGRIATGVLAPSSVDALTATAFFLIILFSFFSRLFRL